MNRNEGSDTRSPDSLTVEADATGELNLRHVFYFHNVASEGSIARAARHLGVSQSTISEQIKALELFLETPLFERGRGGLRLNQAGRRVYEHSKIMFKAARRLVHELNPRRNRGEWVLEVGVSPAVSRFLASERLLPLFELRDVLPRVRFETFADLMEDLVTGEIDLLICENEPPELHRGKVGVRKLTETPLVIVAAPTLARRVEKFPAGLETIPFVNYTQSCRYRWRLDALFFEHGLSPEVVGETDDVALLALLARRGKCAVAVPKATVASALQEQSLVLLGPVDTEASIVYASYSEVNTPQLVRRALEALLGHEAAAGSSTV